jgi:hypothetical protein
MEEMKNFLRNHLKFGPFLLMTAIGAGLAACGGSSGSSAKKTPTPTATPTATATACASPTATPATDAISFSPSVTTINSGTAGQFTIDMTAVDSNGTPIAPSVSNPIDVTVYGAPAGSITPSHTLITSGSAATFTYDGTPFPNNIMIDAWIKDTGTGGAAIGQTLILQQNPTCALGTQNYSVPLTSTVPKELQLNAAVGYTNAASVSGHLQTYTIDTGSLGTIVNKSDVPANDGGVNTLVIGPAGPGSKCYDSSNNAYFGHFYLAPVSIQVTSGSGTTTVQTDPIIVLVADQFCTVDNCTCLTKLHCSTPDIHYLGVGFDRNGQAGGGGFDSPTENAFLHVTDVNNGVDINPGYILGKAGVTLGINSTTGYNTIALTPNATVPGDWTAQQGCYSFPGLTTNPFCGTGLLDVGISQMYIDLPMAQWPTPAVDPTSTPANTVPMVTAMTIQMGDTGNPALSYSYSAVQPPTQPTGPAPTYSRWIDTTNKPMDQQIFVNTGRNPLNCVNYLYAGQCGQVGFEAVSPPPAGCPAPQ